MLQKRIEIRIDSDGGVSGICLSYDETGKLTATEAITPAEIIELLTPEPAKTKKTKKEK